MGASKEHPRRRLHKEISRVVLFFIALCGVVFLLNAIPDPSKHADATAAPAAAAPRRPSLRRPAPAETTAEAAVEPARSAEAADAADALRDVAELRADADRARRTALAGLSKSSSAVDVTLVAHASADRAWMLRNVCDRWPGQVSTALFVPEAGAAALRNDVSANCGDAAPCLDAAQAGGAAFRCGRVAASLTYGDAAKDDYPINELRNAALRLVRTTHILVVDIDFWPSSELHGAILAQADLLRRDRLAALVVPAFARKAGEDVKDMPMAKLRQKTAAAHDFVPQTFLALASCVERGDCIVFDMTWNRDAHSTTDSGKWLGESAKAVIASAARAVAVVNDAYGRPLGKDAPAADGVEAPEPRRLKCFKSYRFEPYVVVRYDDVTLPTYDEAFKGYGKNKIEHIAQLRYTGFLFSVLPIGFLCHVPHPWSRAKKSWMKVSRNAHDTDGLYKDKVAKFNRDFKDGLLDPTINRTFLCKKSK